MPETTDAQRLDKLVDELERLLKQLKGAAGFAKPRYQEPCFRTAADIADRAGGIVRLYELADRFDDAGLFHGGPWEHPDKLLPALAGACLKGDGSTPTLELLSELRILAIATGRVENEDLDADGARAFLWETCAKNLDLVFPRPSEESRARTKLFDRARRLYELVRREIEVDGLSEGVLEEVELLAAQRPIRTQMVEEMIARLAAMPDHGSGNDVDRRLQVFERALGPLTELARRAGSLPEYRSVLRRLDEDDLVAECIAFSKSMHETGLVSRYHAVPLRYVARRAPARIVEALQVSPVAIPDDAELAKLVRASVFPELAGVIRGLAGTIERGLVARTEVAAGLRKLLDLTIRPEARDVLAPPEGISPNSVLVAGALAVLGQPLGIGQGNAPTCQSARGLSLWSLHAPGMLLGMIAGAARDGSVPCDFEGVTLRSDLLGEGLAKGPIDADLDAVSRLLVPHLDRLYAHMMAAVAARGEDGHRWVNRALYGRWVPAGFESVFTPFAPQRIRSHHDFVKRFLATHHPDYNDGHELVYPNPVGIMVTDVRGRLLGPHAVSIQRIARDLEGRPRVYFYNPNNEGRQDWGQGIRPTVAGHGEIPGESSLPFESFSSRLYAFHFDPMEEGEVYAIPEDLVAGISELARTSWGESFDWND